MSVCANLTSKMYYYIDFLVRSFDIKSKTSRKNFWIVLLINTILMVLLVSIGLAIPKGMPLKIYIAISSIISIPLFIPYITIVIRRLNDVSKSRLYALLMLVPMGLGMIPLLIFCAKKSCYNIVDDFSKYKLVSEKINIIKVLLNNIMVIYPFIYLIYIIIKVIIGSGILGVNLALLSISIVLCILTIIEITTSKFHSILEYWKLLKELTTLSSAMLTIILYKETQSFIEATIIVYLYFYVMIIPFFLIYELVKIKKIIRTINIDAKFKKT